MHLGVCPINTLTEKEFIKTLGYGKVDIQVTFQCNEGYMHETPKWNPYIGNDYISKVQKMFPDRVIGLAKINPWWQAPKKYEAKS